MVLFVFSRTLAYGLWVALKVVSRRTSVFLTVSTVAALSTVVTLALLASDYPVVSENLVLDHLKRRIGLSIVEDGSSEVGVCRGFLEYGGYGLEVLVLIPLSNSSFWSLYNVREPDGGSILLGYMVFDVLKPVVGGLASLDVDGRIYSVKVGGVVRFNNALDIAVIASPKLGITGCTLGYRISDYNPLDVIVAFSRQLSGSLAQWYTISLIALALAVTLASLKALLDLEGELLELEAQGAPRGLVLIALVVAFTFSTLTGVSYGFVLSSIASSTLASYIGFYIPPPPLTMGFLVKALLLPSIVSAIVPVVVGVMVWRFKGY